MSVLQLSQDTKVREIVKIYRRVETLHPIASEVFESPELKCMFWNTLIHDLGVIRRRSQNLADGEITAVQKAFEVLMKGEADENAAIEIYMDEIIGLKAIPKRGRAKTLAHAIQTRDNILNQLDVGRNTSSIAASQAQSVLPSSTIHSSGSPNLTRISDSRMDESTGPSFYDDHEQSRLSDQCHGITNEGNKLLLGDRIGNRFPNSAAGDEENETPKRLFLTYLTAKNDFHAIRLKGLERTKAAKFLRDTTENCIAYIASRENSSSGTESINLNIEIVMGQATLDEMRSTLQEAKLAAEAGSGGKKRRFDDDWTKIPEGPAKSRPSSGIKFLGNRDPVPRGQTLQSKLGSRSLPRRIVDQPASKPVLNINHRLRSMVQPEGTPQACHPASAGQSNRSAFSIPIVRHKKRSSDLSAKFGKHNPKYPVVHGDCYRPSY